MPIALNTAAILPHKDGIAAVLLWHFSDQGQSVALQSARQRRHFSDQGQSVALQSARAQRHYGA